MKRNILAIVFMICYFFVVCCAPCDDGIVSEDETENNLSESSKVAGNVTHKDSVLWEMD